MTAVVLDIKKWGNNLGVRLPAAIVREAHLHENQRVRITVEGNHVMIEPVADEILTLEQRLSMFDPQRHAGEVMEVSASLGAEKW